MQSHTSVVDIAIDIDDVAARSTTRLTMLGTGAFYVLLESELPDRLALRLVSTYLGDPGTAARVTHEIAGDGFATHMRERPLDTAPADVRACVLDQLARLQELLEEWDLARASRSFRRACLPISLD